MRTLLKVPLLLGIFASQPALALPLLEDQGFLLEGNATFTSGIGAPTVDWDETNQQYVMYFEAGGTPLTNCATYWAIGRATSPDGLTWTLDANPVLTPNAADPTSLYACSVSQPALLIENGVYHLFVGMGTINTNANSGTNQATGIGHFTSTDGITFSETTLPVIAPNGSTAPSMPTAIGYDGEIHLLWSEYPDIKLATRDSTGTWTPQTDPILTPETAGSWSETWLFTPAVTCKNGPETYPFTLSWGADDAETGRNYGQGISADLVEWWVSTQNNLDSQSLDYPSLKHIDTLEAEGETLLYYSMDNPNTGLKAIGLATTSTTWGTPTGKSCTSQETIEAPPDTGTPDTNAPDTDTSAPDTGAPDTGAQDTGISIPGCNNNPTAPALLISAASLAVIFRRRQEQS